MRERCEQKGSKRVIVVVHDGVSVPDRERERGCVCDRERVRERTGDVWRI